MTPCYLYRVRHINNGRSYIGISTNPPKRWLEHQRDAKVRPQGRFHRALGKYGAAAFTWSIVREFPSSNEAKLAEICFIYLEQPEYNLTAGGDGGWGYKPTRDAIERGAAKRRGRPLPSLLGNTHKLAKPRSKEAGAKQGAKLRGRKRSPEAVAKTTAANLGSVRSPDACMHISIAQSEYQARRTPEAREKSTRKAREALASKRAAARAVVK